MRNDKKVLILFMKLSIEYLNQRHDYWKWRIGDKGIWNPLCFLPVTMVIRKDCRSYNGMFQRKIVTKGKNREVTDKIIIYNKVEDFNECFLDSVLVHEMIHQYIIQNEIKDTRSHGRIFKGYMNMINRIFPDELKINVKGRNPGVAQQGPGEKLHTILLMEYNDGTWFLAVVNSSKKDYFEGLLKKWRRKWGIRNYYWAQSGDVYFNNFRRCTRVLHGLKKSREEMTSFCTRYKVILI